MLKLGQQHLAYLAVTIFKVNEAGEGCGLVGLILGEWNIVMLHRRVHEQIHIS
jgi:hypothetical protein